MKKKEVGLLLSSIALTATITACGTKVEPEIMPEQEVISEIVEEVIDDEVNETADEDMDDEVNETADKENDDLLDDYLTYNGTPWVIVENGHYAVNPELFEINKDVTIMHGEKEETLEENWNESWDAMKDWTESDFLIGRDQAVLQYVYENFDENGIYIGATTIDDAGTHDIVESETPHDVTVDEITDEEAQSVIDVCGLNVPSNKFKDFKKDYVKFLNGQITWDELFNTWSTQQPSTPTCGSNCPSNCGSNCGGDCGSNCGGNCPSNNPCPSDCGSNTGDGNCGNYCPTNGQLCVMDFVCASDAGCNGFQYY